MVLTFSRPRKKPSVPTKRSSQGRITRLSDGSNGDIAVITLDTFCLIVRNYQLLIGALIGFTGVILTQITNAYLSRRQIRDQRIHEKEVLQLALSKELSLIIATTMSNRAEINPDEMCKNGTGGYMVPLLPLTIVFDANTSNIGVLDEKVVGPVIMAYQSHKQFLMNLHLFATEPQNIHLQGKFLNIPVENAAMVRSMHDSVLDHLDKGLDALHK